MSIQMITLNMINKLAYHHDFNILCAFYGIDSFIFSLFTLKVILLVNAAICWVNCHTDEQYSPEVSINNLFNQMSVS